MSIKANTMVQSLAAQWRLCNAARGKNDEYCRNSKCKRCDRFREWQAAQAGVR